MARTPSFSVLRRIGVGGLAEVFLARELDDQDRETNRLVALKRLFPADDGSVIDVAEEGRIGKLLKHENIVQTYGFLQTDKHAVLILEYIEGRPLIDLIKRSIKGKAELSTTLIAYIGAHVADALHYAHELTDERGHPMNIVHRDVTPHNVMVSFQGEVRLVDFGIARHTGRRQHTATGVMKGKIRYMAPEQLRSAEVDSRTDIYALGCTLYECAARERLFPSSASDQEVYDYTTLTGLGNDARRLFGVPSGLREVIRKATALDPARRYRTANEMRDALVPLTEGMMDGGGRRALGRLMRLIYRNDIRDEKKATRPGATGVKVSFHESDVSALDLMSLRDGDADSPTMVVPINLESSDQNRRRVLLIDDSPTILEILKVYLMGGGYDYMQATNPDAGLKMVQQHKPGLVISDIRMPGMTGFELVEKIRSHPTLNGVGILLVSSDVSAQERAKAVADGFIPKPIDGEQLAAEAKRIIETRTTW